MKNDGFDSFDSSMSSSTNSSNFDDSSKECCSSPNPLGWPIRKAQMIEKSVEVSIHDSKMMKLDSQISG